MEKKSIRQKIGVRTAPFDWLRWRRIGLLFCWLLMSGLEAGAAPPDKLVTNEETIFGTIISNSPSAIDFDGKSGGRRQVGVAELVSIQFGEEPRSLTDARRYLLSGDYQAALAAWSGITPSDRKAATMLIQTECDYIQVAAIARQALAAASPSDSAQEAVATFLSRYSRTIHRYEIIELAGQLAVAAGDKDAAIGWFKQLADGPSAFVIRAARLEGEALLKEGDPAGAGAAFERALAIRAGDAASQQEKLVAELGRAGSLIDRGRADEAVKLIQQLLAAAEPPPTTGAYAAPIVSQGYALLGRGWLAANQPQDALLAYLTVDLVYPGDPDLHAESLFRLAELWTTGGYPQRAADARRRLVLRYPESRWAAELSAVAD